MERFCSATDQGGSIHCVRAVRPLFFVLGFDVREPRVEYFMRSDAAVLDHPLRCPGLGSAYRYERTQQQRGTAEYSRAVYRLLCITSLVQIWSRVMRQRRLRKTGGTGLSEKRNLAGSLEAAAIAFNSSHSFFQLSRARVGRHG